MRARDRWVSRTSLSKQADALRLSLLVALGLLPLACEHSAFLDGEGGGGLTAQGGGVGYAGAGAESTVASLCSNPVISDTKLAACANGLVHRPAAIACDPQPASQAGAGGAGGSAGVAGVGGAAVPITCTSHADCTMVKWGWCNLDSVFAGLESECIPGCLEDSDCVSGGVCHCDPTTPAGRCVPAKCHVDSDCGPESVCTKVKDDCGNVSFQCSHGVDECKTKADCREGSCVASGIGPLICRGGPACGRPFLIEHTPRLAQVATRTDWLDASLAPSLSSLSPSQRAELTAHWTRLGQMEHASIAAFARFNLQLLSLGAPSDLVIACNRALADETRHAQLCFGLASHYAGKSLGPARLDIQHCFEDNSLEAVMNLVLVEGCIGETVAALEALEGADSATDPVVRDVLQRIAQDEQAHAELAFKFMRWALTQCSPEVRTQIATEAEKHLASAEHHAPSSTPASAARHVVRPLLAAILSPSLGSIAATPSFA